MIQRLYGEEVVKGVKFSYIVINDDDDFIADFFNREHLLRFQERGTTPENALASVKAKIEDYFDKNGV